MPVLLCHGLGGKERRGRSFSENDRLPGELGAFPAFIAVHRKISPNHRGDFCSGSRQFVLTISEVFRPAGGRGVAPVCDRVDHDVVHPGRFGGRGEGDEVILMTVNAAVRDQPDEMQTGRRRFGKSSPECWICREIAV